MTKFRLPTAAILLVLFAVLAIPAAAQTPGSVPAPAPAVDSGDTAFVLISAALVLMMTGPGLALFYGGLVRRKNVLSTIMHSFSLMAVVTVIWAIVGYSFAFAPGNALVGGFDYLFLHNVGAAPNADYAPTIHLIKY